MHGSRRRWRSGLALAGLSASLVVFAAPLGASVEAAPPVNLTFLNINDFHGRIDSNTVKFAGTIEQLRQAAGTPDMSLLLSAGDNVGATLFESASADDQPTIDVLNALGLDASAVGNHEFDQGWPDLRDDIIGGASPAQWDYLGANVYTAGTTTPVLPEYALFQMNTSGTPVTVGVIGVVTQETPSLVSPSATAGLTFGDPVDAVNRVADKLTDGVGDEADVIIAEYHEGAGAGLAEGATLDQEVAAGGAFAKIVTQTSAKVDVIFTGHSHKTYAWDGPIPGQAGTRPILQTGSYGVNIGKVVLTVDPDNGDVVSYTVSNVARTSTADSTLISTYSRVASVNTIVQNAITAAAAFGQTVVGSMTADITTAYSGGAYTNGVYTGGARDDRSKESAMGNLVADSIVASLSSPERGGAQIALVNPGGLRAEFLTSAGVSITYAEANGVLPFLNNLWTEDITGAVLKTVLEQQWQRDGSNNVPSRPYLQLGLSSNMSYTFDASRPEGDRITSIVVNGKQVKPTDVFRVGSFSFLLEGGDNFRAFKQGTNVKDSGLVDRDAWIAYITAKSPLSPNFTAKGVGITNTPTTVVPGGTLQFGLSRLDLTSRGAPLNTTATVAIGNVVIGTTTVTGGAATINMTVPAADLSVPSIPTGAQLLTVTAQPSGTTVKIPVTVTPPATPVSPSRVFDTRPNESPNALRTVPKAQVGGANVLEVKLTDLPGLVPATGVGAVSLNLAVTNASGNGYATAYPCADRKLVASVNYVTGETVSNAVVVPVSPTGTVCFYSLVPVDLVVDVTGYFPTDAAFHAINPNRLFDTRSGQSPDALRTVAQVGPASVLEVKATDLPGLVPATGVAAVSLNVAVTNPAAAGFVTVYPCGTRPFVASVNYAAGETVSNAVIAPVSATGTICFYSLVAADIVVDINGWFETGDAYGAAGPARVFDTRAGQSPSALRTVPSAQVGGSNVLEVQLTNLTGVVPATGVSAVSLNVAVTNPAADGFVTVYPCGTRPFVANVNYVAGQTVSNAVIAPVSATGTVCFYSSASTDLVVDVNGYFAGVTVTG